MDLIDELAKCQNVLYEGFTSTNASGIEWLNEFCGIFLKFCNKMHKFLIFDCDQKTVIIETCFLCITQILVCVKYLEKTIKTEETETCVLTSSRQYFLDRILWCFARLKSTLSSAHDDIILNSLQESNFVTSMDTVIALLEPYGADNNNDIPNKAEHNAQAMFDSEKIRSTVEGLISQTLAFANIALNTDKVALTALCQKVLRECIVFQQACSLDKDESIPSHHNRQFKAVVLENSLYQLEDFVNESLLRLVFQVMVDCSQHSINKLRKLINDNVEEELDSEIADFDVNVDRIVQIGIFAMAFSPDIRAKTTVRSCLASLESLDSILIPSLYIKNDFYSKILEDHYNREIEKFQNAIQNIIDTVAFCKSFDQILSDCIRTSQQKFDKIRIGEVLEIGKVLDEHFRINEVEFLSEENSFTLAKEKYDDFNLMLNECLAVMASTDHIEDSRILKRLKILRSVVKKLSDSVDKNGQEQVITGSNVLNKSKPINLKSSEIVFESFGITPSITSILYKPRMVKNISDSMKGNTSKLSVPMEYNSAKVKKRVSLRVAMFKRQKSNESQTAWNEQSTNLQITEILDQITDLSTAFSKNV